MIDMAMLKQEMHPGNFALIEQAMRLYDQAQAIANKSPGYAKDNQAFVSRAAEMRAAVATKAPAPAAKEADGYDG
jgi:hypothetical protein